MRQALLIFAKNAILGRVKTRLAATIGNAEALAVYKCLLQYTQQLSAHVNADKIVWYSEFIPRADGWDGALYQKMLQAGGDLGERMEHAFFDAFDRGYAQVAVIGTDCPELTEAIIQEAFEELEWNDVVIGPAADGGFYLLATRFFLPQLFKNISWSTAEVFQQVLLICAGLSLSVHLLPVLSDIDTEADLAGNAAKILF